ncbi:putative MscS family protein.1 [Defluviimonas aquaemixtae]|uniref:Putative MscS family protein.1 n=1 Tax=Albidovulum aquaemixtae TaxID=1542388 RepID=A0A2R8BKP2_9RHOB|nr:mechanosensitive ion channel domain-containing protein [Defluviimonas aquaemixtae]SPH23972.1 putative MscS family protein.1 [Defluviimonas aquaemixtae]
MEEIDKKFTPILSVIENAWNQTLAASLDLLSIAQIVAVVTSLVLAILLKRAVARAIGQLRVKSEGKLLRRALQTASSISLPIAWVVGLWLSLALLNAASQPTALVRLFASLINAWVVIRILSILIPNHVLAGVVSWTIWGIAALNAVRLLDPTILWMDSVQFSSGSVRVTLWTVVQGAVVTGVLLWLAYHSSGFIRRRLEAATALSPTMQVLTSKIVGIVLMVLAIIFGVQAVGIDLTVFAVFSGALGLGIGLGMQRTVANFVAGFTMLADRSIKPGDVIEIMTGEGPTYGEVKTLAGRYVSVRTRAGTETLIPNELLISNPVTNWTFTDKRIRRSIMVGVAYSTDVEKAQTLCVESALACNRVLKVPKPLCLIRGFGESSVDLEVRFWISDPEEGVANIGSDVYLEIWKAFRVHGIEIPFPQRDLHIRSGIQQLAAAE